MSLFSFSFDAPQSPAVAEDVSPSGDANQTAETQPKGMRYIPNMRNSLPKLPDTLSTPIADSVAKSMIRLFERSSEIHSGNFGYKYVPYLTSEMEWWRGFKREEAARRYKMYLAAKSSFDCGGIKAYRPNTIYFPAESSLTNALSNLKSCENDEDVCLRISASTLPSNVIQPVEFDCTPAEPIDIDENLCRGPLVSGDGEEAQENVSPITVIDTPENNNGSTASDDSGSSNRESNASTLPSASDGDETKTKKKSWFGRFFTNKNEKAKNYCKLQYWFNCETNYCQVLATRRYHAVDVVELLDNNWFYN